MGTDGETSDGSSSGGGGDGSSSGSRGGGSTGSTGSTGGSTSTGSTVNLCEGGAVATAFTGHAGHALTIDAGDLEPGTPLGGLNIQGGSGHPHTIDLSAADVDALLAGESVTVTSTFDANHTHDVTIECMA